MPQLQINQGPQDALLYDNSKSYFTNVGYTRTSNFQMELRDVDAQNNADFGSTVQFVIPKAADLLGPVDLTVKLQASGTCADSIGSFVESVGFALIDKVTFSVGSHDIETVTGEQLNMINELMRPDDVRLGVHTVLKTGRSATRAKFPRSSDASTHSTGPSTYQAHTKAESGSAVERVIWNGSSLVADSTAPKELVIPLGLFFTKHPSQYFPLAAIDKAGKAATIKAGSSVAAGTVPTVSMDAGSCKLRCHYYHVTGPEATTLMNKEHVRLLKLWQNQNKIFKVDFGTSWSTQKQSVDMDLSFLHPVQELVIVIRKSSDINNTSMQGDARPEGTDQKGTVKNWFAYHGGGFDPNPDNWYNCGNTTAENGGTPAASFALDVQNFKLTLNGQERHPSTEGISRKYLMERLMPLLHSNTTTMHQDGCLGAHGSETGQHGLSNNHCDSEKFHTLACLQGALDRKEIYVFPFAIAPENTNPSGAVNFSKVSHARLTVDYLSKATVAVAAVDFQMDVYGVNYNWLQIKDGRALTSFA
jgi:hypothetical protein